MDCKRRRQGIEDYTGTHRNRDDAGAVNAREKNFAAAVLYAAVLARRPDPLLARLAHDRRLPVRHQLPGGLPIPDTRGGVRLVHPVHGLPALARAARRNRAPAPGWGGRRSLPGNRYVDRLRPLPSNNARERAHLSLPAPFCFPGGETRYPAFSSKIIGTVAGAGTLRLLPDRTTIHFHQARGSLMCPLIDLVCVRGPARRPGIVTRAPGFPRTGEKCMTENIQTRSPAAEPPGESRAAGGKVRLIPFYNEETKCKAQTG